MSLVTEIIFWICFHAGVFLVLGVDLYVFQRRARPVTFKESATWVMVWVGLSLLFNLLVSWWKGPGKGLEFLTAYLIEYSLSVDNIFVFVLIFSYFGVPFAHQHRVLFWGVLGAIAMRGTMIAAGVVLVHLFDWTLYLFGLLLVFAAVKMIFFDVSTVNPNDNPAVRLARKLLPISDRYEGARFTTRAGGRFQFTPLAVVLIMVETTDLIFAFDSIPAIFAISSDPFIIYTSNICAVLGLRALYFLVAALMYRLAYLRYALAFILIFIGAKMLAAGVLHIPTAVSLGVTVTALVAGVVASLVHRRAPVGSADVPRP